MKIGILTMNYATNYGGILQVYALSQYLKSQGHDVKYINYNNSGKSSILAFLAKLESRILQKKERASVFIPKQPLTKCYLQNFMDFKEKNLDYTQKVDEKTISNLCKSYDAVIVGSDQIWNDVYRNKLIYYFDWKFDGRKIAYAACTNLQTAPFVRKKQISKLLSSFDTITVRDRNTYNYVENLKSTNPKQVVDPSCLYDYKDFITENPIGRPYILTYILSCDIKGGNENAIRIIKQHIGDMPVVSVCIPSLSIASKSISDVFIDEASPAEWVNLFYHAAFVYTDSFHGVMFSMKFQKPFIAYMKEGGRMSRLQDLIITYNLNNIVSEVAQIRNLSFDNLVDYKEINPVLDNNITVSKKILLEALK